MATQAGLGQTAIANSDYTEAVAQFTAALKTANSPLWLINRSTAYQRLGKHELALADADNAVLAATQRARREQIATAHFRRAVALHGLKRYGDARLCLTWCRKLNEKDKALGIWQAKIVNDYTTAEKEGRLDQIQCTVKEIPDPVTEVGGNSQSKSEAKPAAKFVVHTPAAVIPTQTPKEKIRHEWYQSSSKVTIMIFAKGIPKEQAEVVIEEGSLEVRFPVGDSGTYDYTVTPLFSRIDPKASEFRITPQKIEINLHKEVSGQKWGELEGTEPIVPSGPTADTKPAAPAVPAAPLNLVNAKAPSYPTSSRSGPKDWDSLASAALKEGKTEETFGDDDDDEGDPTDAFFKKLYKDADPDTRRAMMKSYQESNGTSISTNWSDVGKGKVETMPPEGVEAKKWGE